MGDKTKFKVGDGVYVETDIYHAGRHGQVTKVLEDSILWDYRVHFGADEYVPFPSGSLELYESARPQQGIPTAPAVREPAALSADEVDDDDYIPGDDDGDGWIDRSDVGWDADGRMITVDLSADKLIEVLREMNQPDNMEWDNSYPFGVYAPLEQAGYVEYHNANERFELTQAGRAYLATVDAAAGGSAPDAYSVEGIHFEWFSEQGQHTEKTLDEASRHIAYLIQQIRNLYGKD